MPLPHAPTSADTLPGAQRDRTTMPGHWLLARMGKRGLRPGGRELTRQMLTARDIHSRDDVVAVAPGLDLTARLALHHTPAPYTGIERNVPTRGRLPWRRC